MIKKDKNQRPSAAEILEHAWFKSNNNFNSQFNTQDKKLIDNIKRFRPENAYLGRLVLAIASSQLVDNHERMSVYQVWRKLD